MTTAMEKRQIRALREFEPFQSVREEVESLWSQLVGDRGNRWLVPLTVPALDLSETANSVVAQVDLPGFKAEDINVQISRNVLTVSGDRAEEKKAEGETFHRIERRSGSFSRSVTLPVTVDENKVDARYRDGVLTITMQKTDEAKGHKIQVNS
jgi:HSP20 family protein